MLADQSAGGSGQPRGIDYILNLSEGGIFIATEKVFRMGDEIAFQISFPVLA